MGKNKTGTCVQCGRVSAILGYGLCSRDYTRKRKADPVLGPKLRAWRTEYSHRPAVREKRTARLRERYWTDPVYRQRKIDRARQQGRRVRALPYTFRAGVFFDSTLAKLRDKWDQEDLS